MKEVVCFFIFPSLAVLWCCPQCCCVLLEVPGYCKWFCNFLSVLNTMQANQVTTPWSWVNYPCFVTFQVYVSFVGEDFHCCFGFYICLVLVLFYQVLHVNQEHQLGSGKEEGLEALWARGRETWQSCSCLVDVVCFVCQVGRKVQNN